MGQTTPRHQLQEGDVTLEVDVKNPEDLPGPRPTSNPLLRRWDSTLTIASAVLLIAMVSASVLQVFMRYVLNRPLAWPEEFSRWVFLWLVMVGSAIITLRGGHIRMPMFAHMLPKATRPYTDLLAILLSALALSIVGVLGWELMLTTTSHSIVGSISYRWLYLSLPVGAVLSLISLLRSNVDRIPLPGVIATVLAGAALGPALIQFTRATYLVVFDPTTLSLVASVLFLILGAPVAHSLLLGAAIAFFAGGLPSVVVANQFASQISTNFTMLAIPFFIFMGALMNAGGITTAIIDLAMRFVGHIRGGLGQVNILASTILGGLSGSSSADSAMVAKLLAPDMTRAGYPKAFTGALTAVGSITTTLIPPSISFLLYASLAGVSVGGLFMAGVIPGLIFAAALMAAVYFLTGTVYPKVKTEPVATWAERGRSVLRSLPALVLPLGILMLLRGGAVTATEAGAVACVFALVIGVAFYRKLNMRSLWESAKSSAADTAVIMFLLAASGPLSWILIAEQVPARIARLLVNIANPTILMIGIVVFLVVIGLILEPPPAQVLVVPILAPIAQQAGIDLTWLGVVLVLTVMMGQITPPVGGLVFIVAAVVKANVSEVFWECRWLYIPIFAVIAILVAVPDLALWLPRVLGFGV